MIASGTKVFDWEVPKEWNIQNSYLEHLESGERYAEFKASNLHVVGYSVPVDQILTLEELKTRIFTLPDQPSFTPYVTSYYREYWGFCMSQNDKDSLPTGQYRALIDSTLEDGELHISHALLRGERSDEIFLVRTYVIPQWRIMS